MTSIWSRLRGRAGAAGWSSLFGLPDASADPAGSPQNAQKQVDFTIAVIALGAKMAAADGEVTPAEIVAFNEVFQAPPEERANVRFFFDLARRSQTGAEAYARQAARVLDGHKPVLEDLLSALFHIARADGQFGPDEDAYLERVARAFGFDAAEYRRIRALNLGATVAGPVDDDPWLILGLEPGSSREQIRTKWRELVRQNHPDLVMAEGLPAEFLSIANAKLARINAAYVELSRPRSADAAS